MAARKRTKQRKKATLSKRAQADKSRDPDEIKPATAQKQLETQLDPTRLHFPIVGIGASAGGLEALDELFKNMPADTGMAFVVVTHLHPGYISMLPELLRRKTKMPVVEAAEGMRLEPNRVYVGPPGVQMSILEGKLHPMETDKKEAPRLPIDYFLRSLATDQRERAICIVLSGTGTDGTLGMKAIKAESGMAMVQQLQSAKYAGMPSSAIGTGLADYIEAPVSMPKQLVAYAQAAYLTTVLPTELPAVEPEPLQKIFALLRVRTGNDFSVYKINTIHRRIERRMNVHQIKNPGGYVQYLHENPHEIDVLFKELLISVTNFFRDAEAWEALRPRLEELVTSRADNQSLRVWVPGCATGEEAYSMAIALREAMDKVGRQLVVQIFGTDLDAEAIQEARTGRYPDGIAVDVSPKRLGRYFSREDGAYRVGKEIRDMVIFAPHNVIKQPPFTKVDVISCRNLLIYLNAETQKKLLQLFHYALKRDGILFLGPSENLGGSADLFDVLDNHWKMFRCKSDVGIVRAIPEIPIQPVVRDEAVPGVSPAAALVREAHIATQIQRVLLKRFAPASVVVNDRGDIMFIQGRTGTYLEPAAGEPRNNVLDMAREGLQIELSAAMRQCARTGADVNRENIRDQRIAGLERELQHRKESQQTTLEELETSNEELKSANEELQSTNEELQSANEELETSKEEMQSINEELTTVNAELQSKVDELAQATDDMQNLLNSTEIATVFLDNALNIKRFTTQAWELVMLRDTDVGRPISELASNLYDNTLVADCAAVLKTLNSRESEVRTKDGSWYLMRIMPYRTAENVIAGLVLRFLQSC